MPDARVCSFLVVCLALACGGRAEQSADPGAGGFAGSGLTSAGGGGSPAGSGGEPGGLGGDTELMSPLPGCPDARENRCTEQVALTLRFDGSRSGDEQVWAEPLQLPQSWDDDVMSASKIVDPEDWDRSPLPAGACVLRLHGLPASCLTNPWNRIELGPCGQEGPRVIPRSYYETYDGLPSCETGTPPGCANAERGNSGNQHWYVLPDGAGSEQTLLVLCAGICANATSARAMCAFGGPVP